MNANRFLIPGDRVPKIPETSVASQAARNEAARITTPFGSVRSDQKFAKAIIVPDSAAVIVSRQGAPQFPCMMTEGSVPEVKLGGNLWATRLNRESEIFSEGVEIDHEATRGRAPPLKAANSRHFPTNARRCSEKRTRESRQFPTFPDTHLSAKMIRLGSVGRRRRQTVALALISVMRSESVWVGGRGFEDSAPATDFAKRG